MTMIMPNGITRGMEVRDAQNGLAGMCTGLSETINGSQQVCIQPPVKTDDSTVPAAQWVDYQVVDIMGPGISDRVPEGDVLLPLTLGMVVEDNITGFRGTLVERTQFINGCISYCVMPRTNFGDNDPKPVWLDQHRLKAIPTEPLRTPVTKNPKGGSANRSGMPRKA